jgi:hypothetical protein
LKTNQITVSPHVQHAHVTSRKSRQGRQLVHARVGGRGTAYSKQDQDNDKFTHHQCSFVRGHNFAQERNTEHRDDDTDQLVLEVVNVGNDQSTEGLLTLQTDPEYGMQNGAAEIDTLISPL